MDPFQWLLNSWGVHWNVQMGGSLWPGSLCSCADFEGLAAFRPQAGTNHFKCNKLFHTVCHRIPLPINHLTYQWQMYTWMVLQHPTNTSSAVENAEHLKLVSLVFCYYLTSTDPFTKWPGEQAEYMIQLVGSLSYIIIHYLIHLQTMTLFLCGRCLGALGVLGCVH